MKLRKHISFKQHEKYLYDFINDKNLVPDSSALIKELLKNYMNEIKIKKEDIIVETPVSKQENTPIETVEVEHKKLEAYDPKKDISPVVLNTLDKDNEELLRELDL